MTPGCNSEYCLVDERITGIKPKSLTFEEAASVPLTSLTAWEGMIENMKISPSKDNSEKSILILGGAGGVGSVAIQIAKHVLKLKVSNF